MTNGRGDHSGGPVFTVLCSDIVGSTELYATLGDVAAHALIARHDQLARRVIDGNGGRWVKGLGDGVLAVFTSPRAALATAVELQRSLPTSGGGTDPELLIRVGLSAGEVVEDADGDVHGAAVVTAARITAKADGGQILAADVVARLVGTVPGITLRDVGPHRLKGFDDPVLLYEVQSQGQSPRRPVAPAGRAVPSGDAFIGRQWERSEVRAALAAARAGRGELILITGEAGMGKTRLAWEVTADAAARGCATVWAACWEGDDAPPYWPWMQVVRSLTKAPASDAGPGPGIDAQALAVLVPELSDSPRPERPADNPADYATARARLFDAVADLLVTRSAPLVIVFDDLHWADEPTILLMRHLSAYLSSAPVAVLGTYRDTHVSAGHRLLDLIRWDRRVVLSGLHTTEVAVLMAGVTGNAPSDEAAAEITDRSGGNPLFVRELARLGDSQGPAGNRRGADRQVPESIRALLAQRLDQVPTACRRMLDVACVLPVVRVDVLSEATAEETTALVAQIEEAIVAHVLQPIGVGCYAFTHGLFRDELYDELGQARRGMLHEQAGEALERLRSRGYHVDPSELAHHFGVASATSAGSEKATRYCLEAGDRCMESLAYEEAVRHYEQALACVDRMPRDDRRHGEVLLSLADAAAACGDRSRSRELCMEAVTLARSSRSGELLARAALSVTSDPVGFEVVLFDHEQERVLREALTALADGASPLRALVSARLSVALSLSAPIDERRELAEQAVAGARACGDEGALAYALAAHVDTIAGPGDVDRRLAEADEVVALAAGCHDRRLQLLGLRLRLIALLEVGDMLSAHTTIESYARLTAEVNQPLYGWIVPLWRGMQLLMNGETGECERGLEEALAAGTKAGSTNAALMCGVQRWFLLMETNQGAPALAALYDVLGSLSNPGTVQRVALALGLAAAGRREEARAHLDAISVDALASIPVDSEWLPMLGELSGAIALVEGHPLARWAYDALYPHRHRFMVEGIGAVMLGSVEHHLGLLAAALGRPEEAHAHFEAALAAHRRIAAPALVSRTLHASGRRPGEGEARANLFRREGDCWTIAYAGRSARIKDMKGLGDVARLLAQPGREVHVLDLAGSTGPSSPQADDVHVEGDTGEVLDQPARDAYRARLAELDDDIAEAERLGDPVPAARARAERDALVDQLAGAYGLGGRVRRSGDRAERARSTVTRRIHDALRRVEQHHPEVAGHLRRSIKTGTFCVYEPDQPIDWQT